MAKNKSVTTQAAPINIKDPMSGRRHSRMASPVEVSLSRQLSQKQSKTTMEAVMRVLMVIQMEMRCHRSWATRSKKKPREHLATAMPRTTKF